MGLLFDLPRIAINATDARALSVDEIRKYQEANYAAMQQAQNSPYNQLAYLNGFSNTKLPEKPLDERFADFKVRLATAITKHNLH